MNNSSSSDNLTRTHFQHQVPLPICPRGDNLSPTVQGTPAPPTQEPNPWLRSRVPTKLSPGLLSDNEAREINSQGQAPPPQLSSPHIYPPVQRWHQFPFTFPLEPGKITPQNNPTPRNPGSMHLPPTTNPLEPHRYFELV